MTGRRWVLALALLLATPVLAEVSPAIRPMPRPVAASVAPLPPVESAAALRPRPRPVTAASLPAPLVQTAPTLRPRPRPVAAVPLVAPELPLATVQPDASIRRISVLRPQRRPQGLVVAAAPTLAVEPVVLAKPERRKKAERTSRKGSVCGEAEIKGEQISRITSKVKGCGIEDPVRVTSVSGVRLSQAATLDCTTAKALRKWIDSGLQPAFGRTKVVELRVAAHYICRSRNNIKGAKVSEHGRGKAIDIAAVVLENGKTVPVLGGYGKDLRRAYRAACGIFGTTLGPGSDGFHEDHLHFDTASHRNGPYCR